MGRPRERRRPNGSGTERRSKRYRCQHLNPEIRRVKLTDSLHQYPRLLTPRTIPTPFKVPLRTCLDISYA
jgi:hypothetical protein